LHALGRFIRGNWFLLGIVCVVAAAWWAPAGGEASAPARVLSKAAVVAIFVLSGVSLPSEQVRAGLRNVRAHAYLQGFVYVVVPAYFWAAGWLLGGAVDERLLAGFYALAVLPTTISSCIVFTQMAGGNVMTAIFNAVLANLLGVFVSPLLLTLLLRGASAALPAEEVARIFLSLLLTVLLPFVAGQVLRLGLRGWADRHRKRLTLAASALVLLIIFLAFRRAAGSELLRRGAWELAGPLALLAGSNLVLMAAAYGGAKALRLSAGDVTAAVFVAPQKTLALGVPLLTTYFASRPELLAFAMLPVLVYHPWQLLTAGVAKALLRRPASPSEGGPSNRPK